MVFIRLATGSPFLVVRACHDRHITMHAHLKVGHLGNQYAIVGISTVRDITRLAEGRTVFYGDDEIVCQQGIHRGDVPLFVSLIPFVFERKDFGRRLGPLLRGRESRGQAHRKEKSPQQ